MILFVFEGVKREPGLYRTIEKLYFPRNNEKILCSFGNNIYALYKEMQDMGDGADLLDILKNTLQKRNDTTLDGYKSNDFSEIFLFFDYDFHNSQLTLDDINERVRQMLTLFNEETENGKLYINYPMIESIIYTKQLPDCDYVNYKVGRSKCNNFKSLASQFSHYPHYDHIMLHHNEIPTEAKRLSMKKNWAYLEDMNVCKANFTVTGVSGYPEEKSTISQYAVFDYQLRKYVCVDESVAILNSFPLFLYDYFK